ncbi:hypothetical protein L1049_016373 [Liquidambar formosana]|uniref:Diacylglycerol O-acyltransferase 3, cytosolic n=1 Tax=Liquidambar formosana TaxID=63359 RepID=A0AAP0RZA5_LIQFO
MEVSGGVLRRVPYFSGAGIDTHVSKPSFSGVSIDAVNRFSGQLRLMGSRDLKVSVRSRKFSGFSSSDFGDDGHLRYYYVSPTCGGKKEKEKEKGSGMVTTKKKLKLLKGLSRDLSMFSELGFGVDPNSGLVGEVEGKMISEAAEVLLKQLQQLRAEEKELKRKRKQEKAKLKATRMKTIVDCESSSSESSDSECEEVIDMGHLRNETFVQPVVDESQPVVQEAAVTLTLPGLLTQEGSTTQENGFEDRSLRNVEEESCTGTGTGTGTSTSRSSSASSVGFNDRSSLVTAASSSKRIEVCMGNKCKKSGAAGLLEEFEREIGAEGAVVGCKCMGKCRDGPNVRVLNCYDGIQAARKDDSVRTPANPLCIGVGLEDVGVIVANFFGEDRNDINLAAVT